MLRQNQLHEIYRAVVTKRELSNTGNHVLNWSLFRSPMSLNLG